MLAGIARRQKETPAPMWIQICFAAFSAGNGEQQISLLLTPSLFQIVWASTFICYAFEVRH